MISIYGKLPEKLVAYYLKQILTGLAYLHETKIIHRDIKPANILVTSQGQIKISDFGCSQQMMTSQTPAEIVQQMKGSIPYMAPEALRQEVLSRKADIWSLGCLALELATGKQPWSEKNWENMFGAIFFIGSNDVVPEISDELSDDLKGFLERCLKREFGERSSALELLEDKFVKDAPAFILPVGDEGSGSKSEIGEN